MNDGPVKPTERLCRFGAKLMGGRFGKVILWVRGVRGDLMHNMVVLVTLHGGPIIMQNFLSMCVVL